MLLREVFIVPTKKTFQQRRDVFISLFSREKRIVLCANESKMIEYTFSLGKQSL